MSTATTTPTRPPRRRTKPAPKPAERLVNGLKVVADEPVVTALPRPAGKPPVALKGYTRITLEDQTVLYACAECDFTGERGQVIRHRAEKHGMGLGGRRKGVDYGDGSKRQKQDALSAAMDLSIGEVVELAIEANNYGEIIANLTGERNELRGKLVETEQELRKFRLAFDRLGFVPREEAE